MGDALWHGARKNLNFSPAGSALNPDQLAVLYELSEGESWVVVGHGSLHTPHAESEGQLRRRALSFEKRSVCSVKISFRPAHIAPRNARHL